MGAFFNFEMQSERLQFHKISKFWYLSSFRLKNFMKESCKNRLGRVVNIEINDTNG